jgi:hypothetical protein
MGAAYAGIQRRADHSQFPHTRLNSMGFPPDVIELQLSHQEADESRGAYNRADRMPERRQMMQIWAEVPSNPECRETIPIDSSLLQAIPPRPMRERKRMCHWRRCLCGQRRGVGFERRWSYYFFFFWALERRFSGTE